MERTTKIADTEKLIREMPKTDLHCHLDGSLRLETLLALAETQKVTLPSQDPTQLRKYVQMDEENCTGLKDYLKAFHYTLAVMQTPEALSRAAYELLEDAHAENVWYIEVRFSPALHTRQGLKLVEVMEAVLQGLKQAEKEFGILWGLIICGIRDMSKEESRQLAELAVAFKRRGVVGFDLAGYEGADQPAKRHLEAFYLIINNNISCTVHAGENFGPESIHYALHYLRTHRLGHAVRLIEDGELLNYVNDHRIPIEICPSSNVQTRVVKDYDSHPLRFYFDYGVRVTVNTDNRLMSHTTVSKELWLAHQHQAFTLQELRDLIIFGFKSAFLPYREKVHLLNRAIKRLNEILEPLEEERL